jgi:hypothetical protein
MHQTDAIREQLSQLHARAGQNLQENVHNCRLCLDCLKKIIQLSEDDCVLEYKQLTVWYLPMFQELRPSRPDGGSKLL